MHPLLRLSLCAGLLYTVLCDGEEPSNLGVTVQTDNCTEDGICGGYKTCVYGKCISNCSDDSMCEANKTCQEGVCVGLCSVAEPRGLCEGNKTCHGGSCVGVCSMTEPDGLCVTNTTCVAGKCIGPCSELEYDGLCEDNKTCIGGRCVGVCSSAEMEGLCFDDKTCIEGRCVGDCSEIEQDGLCDINKTCTEGRCVGPCSKEEPDGLCKDNKTCSGGTCIGPCSETEITGLCEGNKTCSGGKCIGPCSQWEPEGLCGDNKTCTGGRCIGWCSMLEQDGLCGDNKTCVQGKCIGPCSKTETEGLCDSNKTCVDGICIGPCSEAEIHGLCEEKNQTCQAGVCVDVDLCPVTDCGEGEVCLNSVCSCAPGYVRLQNTTTCTRIGCQHDPCGEARCEDVAYGYRCFCDRGFLLEGTGNDSKCRDVSCLYPELNQCQQICRPSTDLAISNYTCDCQEPFVLNADNVTCDLPANSTCDVDCVGGTCTNVSNVVQCVCRKGFVMLDGNCTDMCTAGDITADMCPQGCVPDLDAGFRCNCTGKYTYSGDGVTCQLIDMCSDGERGQQECTSRNANCRNNATVDEGYVCSCLDGYGQGEDGKCTELCHLTENIDKCMNSKGRCRVTSDGQAECRCPVSFQPTPDADHNCQFANFSYIGTLLIKDVYSTSETTSLKQLPFPAANLVRADTPKFSEVFNYVEMVKDVEEAMKTFFGPAVVVNIVEYRRLTGDVNSTLEIQLPQNSTEDFAALQRNCLQGDETSPYCMFPPKLLVAKSSLETGSFKTLDPCDSIVRSQLCTESTTCRSSHTAFSCFCKDGYSAVYSYSLTGTASNVVQVCQDINECEAENPCPEDSTDCINQPGTYQCVCKQGYRNHSGLCVDVCSPNPCENGVCSQAGQSDFSCRCAEGYWGRLCENRSENLKYKDSRDVAIVGGVLGALLGLTLFITILIIWGLKNKTEKLRNREYVPINEMCERPRVLGHTNASYLRD